MSLDRYGCELHLYWLVGAFSCKAVILFFCFIQPLPADFSLSLTFLLFEILFYKGDNINGGQFWWILTNLCWLHLADVVALQSVLPLVAWWGSALY